MAAITTQATGLWSSTGTWTGGVVPGNGDTVTLNHAVTVDDTRIVGVSPGAGAGTPAIRCNSALTIAGTGNLTVRGDIALNNVPLNLSAGAVLEFDAHLAGTPSTARYVCKAVNASDPNAILTVTGSSGNHAIVRSNSGGANGRFTNNGNDRSGLVQASYCDFLRIGDGSNAAFDPISFSADTFSLANCTFDACGSIGAFFGVGFGTTANITLDHVRMTNSPGGGSVGIPNNSPPTGTRQMTNCDFDGIVQLSKATGWTIDHNVFRGLYGFTFGGGEQCATFEKNLVVMVQGQGPLAAEIAPLYQQNYIVFSGSTTNPHYVDVSTGGNRITQNIFDSPDGTDGNGDSISFNQFGGAGTTTVDHNLILNASSTDVGTCISCLGGSNVAIDADHNTFHGDFGLYVGETYAGHTDMLAHARSNLSYSTGNPAFIIRAEVGVVQDLIHAANAHHNGVENPVSGTGYGSSLSFSSGTPGASDVHGDPQLVDKTRNIKTWDTSIGGPGTVAHAADQIGTGAHTIEEVLAYVRAGFVPQSAAYQAAHDNVAPSNGWIGAVQGQVPAPPDPMMAASLM